DASVDGGSVYPVANDWTETGITWENAPAIGGSALAGAGPVAAGTWAEIPLPASVFAAGDGTYSFALASSTSNDAWFSSREGGNAPQLVLEAASG
ncbi:MAG TPA: DNRLRE domain-containing protein, partial [Vicinamibacterales bacterium]|nr:DNRLRE domain-containing protein [Vicinamibacterales bacterium]